jgi:hypothetical protein
MLKCPSMKCWLNSRLWQKWYPTDVIGANRQGLPKVPSASTSYGAWRVFPLIDDVGTVQRLRGEIVLIHIQNDETKPSSVSVGYQANAGGQTSPVLSFR